MRPDPSDLAGPPDSSPPAGVSSGPERPAGQADLIRLRHMLDAAREATGFAAGKQRMALNDDRMLVLALVKCLEILGEAAARVSPETRARYPEVPWQVIVGMRNRLIHVYFSVNLDVVWQTVASDLPPLARTLEAILGPSTLSASPDPRVSTY